MIVERIEGVGRIHLESDGNYIATRTGYQGKKGLKEPGMRNRRARLEDARTWLLQGVVPVDPVLAYVRSMRRDDTTNPGPRGTTERRGGTVVFKQAEEMPEGMAPGEFKREGLTGGEYLEAIIKEYAARFDGQEPMAVNVRVDSPFLDALADALGIEVTHV